MKILSLFIALVFTVMPYVANAEFCLEGRSTVLANDGTVKAGSLEKCYINVKNTSGGSVNDGTLFIHETTEDDGVSVTTGTAAGSVPVCILAKEDGSACADDEMCRCQTYGLNTGVLFDSTNDGASAGDQVFLSESTAGYVESEALGSIAASDWPLGVFLDEETSSDDADVFIRLR